MRKPSKISKILKNHAFIGIFSHFLAAGHQRNLEKSDRFIGIFLKIIIGLQERNALYLGNFLIISPGFSGRYMACPSDPGWKSTKPVTQLCRVIGHPSPPAGNMRKIHFSIVRVIWVDFQLLKIWPCVHIPKFEFLFWFYFSGLNQVSRRQVSAIPDRQTVPQKNSQKANSL